MSISIAEYKALKPRRAKPVQHERILQKQCVRWFKINYPNCVIHHSPNQFGRVNEGKERFSKAYAIMQNHLEEMGRLKGFPDLFIAEPTAKHPGLYIEMKSKTGKISDEQKKVMMKLSERGYACYVAKDLDEFIEIVKGYFGGMLK